MMSCLFGQGGRPRFRPTVEALEGRECPAITATLTDGVLTLVGDDGPNRVAIAELGGGAVRVVGDGEPFQFQGIRAFQVHTLGGDDRVEYGPRATEVVSEVGDRDLSIDVGAGDDRVIVRDHASEVGRPVLIAVQVRTGIDLGTGGDYVLTKVRHSDDVQLDIVSDDGGDRVAVGMLLPAVQKVRAAHANMRLDLAPGGNLVDVSAGNYDDVALALTTAGRGPAPGRIPTDSFALNFDRIEAGQLPGWPLAARQRSAMDLGDSADRLTLTTRGFADVGTQLATGAGDDRVRVRHRMFPIAGRPRLAFDARLGDGDDWLGANLMGFNDAALTFDLGAGADRADVQVGAWVLDVASERWVNVDAQLGTGDDVFRVTTRGYNRVAADLDGGPDGDGPDRIAVTSALPGASVPRRRNLVTLRSQDLDVLRVLGIGYATSDIHLEGDQCLVFFVGGIP